MEDTTMATTKIQWSEVQKMAAGIRRQNANISHSDSFRLAWRNLKLQKALKDGLVEFQFVKVNGDIRTATGTLHPAFINMPENQAEVINQTDYNVQKYYDTEKNAWRCFKLANLL